MCCSRHRRSTRRIRRSRNISGCTAPSPRSLRSDTRRPCRCSGRSECCSRCPNSRPRMPRFRSSAGRWDSSFQRRSHLPGSGRARRSPGRPDSRNPRRRSRLHSCSRRSSADPCRSSRPERKSPRYTPRSGSARDRSATRSPHCHSMLHSHLRSTSVPDRRKIRAGRDARNCRYPWCTGSGRYNPLPSCTGRSRAPGRTTARDSWRRLA